MTMTTIPKPDLARLELFGLCAEQVSAMPPRQLAYAVHLREAQRVLSVVSGVQNPHNTQQAGKVARSFMNSAAVSTEAFTVAQSALGTWRRIDDALSPIIGRRGVAGLYKRSLSLTRRAHPPLTDVFEGLLMPGDYSALQHTLALQSGPVALAASVALLQTFNDLLIKLIGLSLTDRLLRPLLDNPLSSGDAVQETAS